MENVLAGSGRGAVVTGMLLAAFALAACESAEEQEIGALIEEIAILQEKTLAEVESTAAREIAADRELGVGPGEQRLWEERVQAARDSHEETLTKLRKAQASGDWETVYPREMAALNGGSPLAVVARLRDRAQRNLVAAEQQQAAIDAAKRVPDPSSWSTTREPPSVDEVLGLAGSGRETGR